MSWQLWAFEQGEPTMLRDGLTMREAEHLAMVLCRAATFQRPIIPTRAGNIWYMESKVDLVPIFEVICWVQPEEGEDGVS